MTRLEGMSEPERQSWLTLLADGAVFIYLWQAMTQGFGFQAQTFSPAQIGEIFLGMIIMSIILHAVIAGIFDMRKRKEAFTKDERDLRIAAIGTRVGYYGLYFGIGFVIITLLTQYTMEDRYKPPLSVIEPVEMLFALCVICYVVDLTKQAVQIYHYRQN